METISACIVARNEEKVIKRCLESIKDVVDEIILVHDGKCDDKTLEIAKKYTPNIFILKYIGMGDPHRPFCFQKSSCRWILNIDADEFLSDDLKSGLKKIVEKKDIDGYEFSWPIWNGSKYITKSQPKKIVLARREKIYFWGIPHGTIHIDGKIEKSSLVLEHRPINYKWSFKSFFSKAFPWAKIQADYLLKDPDDIPVFQTKNKNYPRGIIMRKKYPSLFPFFVGYIFFRNIHPAEIFSFNMWKGSFLLSIYELILDLNIIKIKLFGRII